MFVPFLLYLGSGKSCPKFKCAKGYEAAPKRPLALSGSGCSGMGGGMIMSMGKEEPEEMEACCNRCVLSSCIIIPYNQ
jgi:hypothetical protein